MRNEPVLLADPLRGCRLPSCGGRWSEWELPGLLDLWPNAAGSAASPPKTVAVGVILPALWRRALGGREASNSMCALLVLPRRDSVPRCGLRGERRLAESAAAGYGPVRRLTLPCRASVCDALLGPSCPSEEGGLPVEPCAFRLRREDFSSEPSQVRTVERKEDLGRDDLAVMGEAALSSACEDMVLNVSTESDWGR